MGKPVEKRDCRDHVGLFRRAHEYLRRCNKTYARAFWDEEHGPRRLSVEEQPLGLPQVLARCLRRQEPVEDEATRVRQEGPADGPREVEVPAPGLAGRGVGAVDDGEAAPASLSLRDLEEILSEVQVWLEEHEGKLPRAMPFVESGLVVV